MVARLATDVDAVRIIQILKNFHAAGGFDFPAEPARAYASVLHYIRTDGFACFVTGKPVMGVLLAQADQAAFAPFRFAKEVIVWVDPAGRGRAWQDLLDAYEGWARENGCSKSGISAQFSMRPAAMDRLLRRAGYRPAETVYVKDL